MKLILIIVLLGLASTVSYATSVTVTTYQSAGKAGILTNLYFENANAATGSSPSVNTALTQTGSSGSYTLTRGSTDRLWSTQFSAALSISAGQWVFDVWAKGASAGTLTISIYITNSAGTVQTTIASSQSTPSIGTSKSQVALRVSGAAASIPADGYIEVSILAPTGGATSFTMYWGSGQPTNFQVPVMVLAA